MKRRDALTATVALFGIPIVGAEIFLSGCTKPEQKRIGLFTGEEIALLDEIGETILPVSENSPGAKAAQIGNFMKVIVTDCYDEIEQKIFLDGLIKFKGFCASKAGDDFLNLSSEKRKAIVIDLDKEARLYSIAGKPGDAQHYFSLIKQLTVWGYFTSEPGATKALRFVPIPGRYEGCIPYSGEAAWLY
ncbi:MAG: gluconate 2-dehydrogenase subunit 3 family protein [Chryseolinea sp.]